MYVIFTLGVTQYSELSNKYAASLNLLENFFPPTCLIRAYTYIYFRGPIFFFIKQPVVKFRQSNDNAPRHVIIQFT